MVALQTKQSVRSSDPEDGCACGTARLTVLEILFYWSVVVAHTATTARRLCSAMVDGCRTRSQWLTATRHRQAAGPAVEMKSITRARAKEGILFDLGAQTRLPRLRTSNRSLVRTSETLGQIGRRNTAQRATRRSKRRHPSLPFV